MSTATIVVIIVLAVIVLAVAGWLITQNRRRQRLREQFGSEYDRAVDEHDSRRKAEQELAQREQRHAKLDIKPLSSTDRDRYAKQWTLIQQEFVDRPTNAVAEADRLVTVVMGERGYPTEGYRQQVSDLSVRHATTLDHYRSAHAIKARCDDGEVATEELREAMVHYRSMFEDLLESDVDGRHGSSRN